MSKNNFEDKSFLTYNQQMRKLRKDKKILCNGSEHKKSSYVQDILILLTDTKRHLPAELIRMEIIITFLTQVLTKFIESNYLMIRYVLFC